MKIFCLCRQHAYDTRFLYLNYLDNGGSGMIRYVDKADCKMCQKRKQEESK